MKTEKTKKEKTAVTVIVSSLLKKGTLFKFIKLLVPKKEKLFKNFLFTHKLCLHATTMSVGGGGRGKRHQSRRSSSSTTAVLLPVRVTALKRNGDAVKNYAAKFY